MSSEFTEKLKKCIEVSAQKAGIESPTVSLEHPEEISHGDFSTNVAMVHAKGLKMNPKVLAEKIVVELQKDKPEEVVSVEVAGPGFINFKLNRSYFIKETQTILDQGEKYGEQKNGKSKKVIVEYSSPNIAKPFTIGHLRSTIIGDSVANILAATGYNVIRDNHLGDWGTQFGKMIVAIKKWGNVEEIKASKDPMRVLVDLYVRFHTEAEKDATLEDEARAWFLKLEQDDTEAKELWSLCIERSLFAFDAIYKELGVSKFDTLHGESFALHLIPDVLKELNEKKLLQTSEGAQVVFFEGEKYPPAIVQKSDGASIYVLRDLATDLWRKRNYGDDITIVNEVGGEQTLNFRQLYEIEKMLGWFTEGQRVHVAHGLYRLKEGKMSTREGNVVWLEDIIKEIKTRARAVAKDTLDQADIDEIALGALKFNDLKRDAQQDIVFSYDEIMNMTGDSGPYLQYACVRARSVIVKTENLGIKQKLNEQSIPASEVENLEKLLVRFPETLARSAEEYKPNILANYLMNLSSQFNNFYAHNVIAQKENPEAPHNTALTQAFILVMSKGLRLLGINIPEKM